MNIKEDIINELRLLQKSDDNYNAHYHADELLCELLTQLGYEEVVNEFSKIEKWYE